MLVLLISSSIIGCQLQDSDSDNMAGEAFAYAIAQKSNVLRCIQQNPTRICGHLVKDTTPLQLGETCGTVLNCGRPVDCGSCTTVGNLICRNNRCVRP